MGRREAPIHSLRYHPRGLVQRGSTSPPYPGSRTQTPRLFPTWPAKHKGLLSSAFPYTFLSALQSERWQLGKLSVQNVVICDAMNPVGLPSALCSTKNRHSALRPDYKWSSHYTTPPSHSHTLLSLTSPTSSLTVSPSNLPFRISKVGTGTKRSKTLPQDLFQTQVSKRTFRWLTSAPCVTETCFHISCPNMGKTQTPMSSADSVLGPLTP